MTTFRQSSPDLWHFIATSISNATGQAFHVAERVSIGGGCINAAFRIAGGGRQYFVKLNSAESGAMFEAEFEGLRELAASQPIRVPVPVCHDVTGTASFLVLEYLALERCGEACCERMGRNLAAMHRHIAPRYGWRRDNTIGATRQSNIPSDDWIAFWREERLGFQLRLAATNRLGRTLLQQGERLMRELPRFFSAEPPCASLLHGDLWGGNAAADGRGEPVIFDPAVYYGDREADIAMTELFGGFSPRFHAAYREAWPLDPGYAVRKTLYNLYHVLNHANLFGGGYAVQAEAMMGRLLSEVE